METNRLRSLNKLRLKEAMTCVLHECMAINGHSYLKMSRSRIFAADELLVKVTAAGMCRTDVQLLDGYFKDYQPHTSCLK